MSSVREHIEQSCSTWSAAMAGLGRTGWLVEQMALVAPFEVDTIAPLDVVAATMIGEAEGEGPFGMYLIGCVVMNRLGDPRRRGHFGHRKGTVTTVADICLAPAQFSCWFDKAARARMQTSKRWLAAQAAAAVVLLEGHRGDDPTLGATHYFAHNVIEPPAWAARLRRTLRHGGHSFFIEE